MSLIVIPARMQSERLKGKPLISICGIPLIVRVAKKCLLSKANHVAIITDSKDVYEICKYYIEHIDVILDYTDVTSGTDRVAIAAKKYSDDIIINVQCDEPFLPPELINNIIEDLEHSDSFYMNSCYTLIDEINASDPNNVKVVLDKDNFALYFSRSPIPFYRKTDHIKYFNKHIGIYGFHRNVLMDFTRLEEGNLERIEKLEQLRALENNIKIKMIKWQFDIISINTYKDIEIAEKFLKEFQCD